jgi:hypothetical protein
MKYSSRLNIFWKIPRFLKRIELMGKLLGITKLKKKKRKKTHPWLTPKCKLNKNAIYPSSSLLPPTEEGPVWPIPH